MQNTWCRLAAEGMVCLSSPHLLKSLHVSGVECSPAVFLYLSYQLPRALHARLFKIAKVYEGPARGKTLGYTALERLEVN